ncbi:MAG: SPOR domain-containing protein [Bacteroidetes bacterium]|nr:SPOR domain-containing protein [Bacteroidota bacterium]
MDSIAASQAAAVAVTQAEAQYAQSVQAYQLPDANLATGESTESQTADGLNSYIAFVELFSTEDKAQQARSSYAAKGINLRIIPPGTFLGNNDQFYLLCAGFEVSLLEAQRLKNKLNEQGINCVIQKF